MELYPSLKPLPKPEKAKRKLVPPLRGTVSQEDYEAKVLREAFHKKS